jgi:hypothetical protein
MEGLRDGSVAPASFAQFRCPSQTHSYTDHGFLRAAYEEA